MPSLSALYGLHIGDLVDMPKAAIDQYVWQAGEITAALHSTVVVGRG